MYYLASSVVVGVEDRPPFRPAGPASKAVRTTTAWRGWVASVAGDMYSAALAKRATDLTASETSDPAPLSHASEASDPPSLTRAKRVTWLGTACAGLACKALAMRLLLAAVAAVAAVARSICAANSTMGRP